ncbi:MAG: hypothetical protein ACI8P7_000220 [Candidatus Azotimanducaceae bacterium]|jgi:hypothetical protein
MKKVNRLFLILITVVGTIAFVRFATKSVPELELPPLSKEDVMVARIEAAVNNKAWHATHWVQWTFMEKRHFVWDKANDLLQVKYNEMNIKLDLANLERGIALNGDTLLEGDRKTKALEFAWAAFCNDSFWLNGPVKLKDPGTSLHATSDTSLLVTYSSGGVSPGDAYEWGFGETGLPSSCRMWVGGADTTSSDGIACSWYNYETTSTGAKVALNHNFRGTDIGISKVKGETGFQALGFEEDPFLGFRK